MNDLVTWLREQIAESEQEARADEWNRPHGPGCAIAADNLPACDCEYWRAVLAQCEAHAFLVEDAAELLALPVTTPYEQGCHDVKRNNLKLIGFAYRHRPGYREEWQP